MAQASKTLEIKGNFSLSQIVGAFITLLTAFGLVGTGVVAINGTPNEVRQEIVSSNDSLLIEMRLLRNEVRQLQIGYLEIQQNKQQIDTLAARQDDIKANQIKGFGALDEQNDLILNSLRDIRQSLPDK